MLFVAVTAVQGVENNRELWGLSDLVSVGSNAVGDTECMGSGDSGGVATATCYTGE